MAGVVAEDAVQGLPSVTGRDLLALLVGPPVIGNAHLVNTQAHFRYLCDDFRLESEPVFFYLDALNDLSLEHLVTGFHVRQVQIREHVGEESQELVSQIMPEVEDAVGSGGQKSGAENDVGPAVDEGGEESFQIIGIVLEVCILHGYEIARRFGKSCSEGSSFSLILFLMQDDNPVVFLGKVSCDIETVVGGCIVDDDDFKSEVFVCYLPDAFDASFQGTFFVEAWDDDSEGMHGDSSYRIVFEGYHIPGNSRCFTFFVYST